MVDEVVYSPTRMNETRWVDPIELVKKFKKKLKNLDKNNNLKTADYNFILHIDDLYTYKYMKP